MRISILTMLCLVACTGADGIESVDNTECVFKYVTKPVCTYKQDKNTFIVTLITHSIDDEIELTQAKVLSYGSEHTLNISEDVTMVKGDVGSMLFDDINFDGLPDLAISTSFGVANQYLDYWIYDNSRNTYQLVGNYPRLLVNQTKKTLTAQIKLNAANYETQVYSWKGDKMLLNK